MHTYTRVAYIETKILRSRDLHGDEKSDLA